MTPQDIEVYIRTTSGLLLILFILSKTIKVGLVLSLMLMLFIALVDLLLLQELLQ